MKDTKENCDHMFHRYILAATLFVLLLVFGDHVAFGQSGMGLSVHGSGGPAPAMKAVKAFEQKTGTPVLVTTGPTAE